MEANKGEIQFGFKEDDPDFLTGANVILTFSPDIEVKEA
jgi:hypothetical protein